MNKFFHKIKLNAWTRTKFHRETMELQANFRWGITFRTAHTHARRNSIQASVVLTHDTVITSIVIDLHPSQSPSSPNIAGFCTAMKCRFELTIFATIEIKSVGHILIFLIQVKKVQPEEMSQNPAGPACASYLATFPADSRSDWK